MIISFSSCVYVKEEVNSAIKYAITLLFIQKFVDSLHQIKKVQQIRGFVANDPNIIKIIAN